MTDPQRPGEASPITSDEELATRFLTRIAGGSWSETSIPAVIDFIAEIRLHALESAPSVCTAPARQARTPGVPVEHDLKTWCEPFARVRSRQKRHEIRKNDRTFMVGDTLRLREWDHTTATYTGEVERVRVTWISYGGSWGLPDDLCVMSIEPCSETPSVKPAVIDKAAEAWAKADREKDEQRYGLLKAAHAVECPECLAQPGDACVGRLVHPKRMVVAGRPAETALCFHAAKGDRCTRYLEGAEAERASIVAWLRTTPRARGVRLSIASSQDIARLAEALEIGECRSAATPAETPSPPWPPASSVTKAETTRRLCKLLDSVWQHFDPKAHEPNDCFCGIDASADLRFRSSGRALQWIEQVVERAIKASETGSTDNG